VHTAASRCLCRLRDGEGRRGKEWVHPEKKDLGGDLRTGNSIPAGNHRRGVSFFLLAQKEKRYEIEKSRFRESVKELVSSEKRGAFKLSALRKSSAFRK